MEWTLTLNLLVSSLLINFANSLDPDQAWQNVGPDMDPNSFILEELLETGVWMVSEVLGL